MTLFDEQIPFSEEAESPRRGGRALVVILLLVAVVIGAYFWVPLVLHDAKPPAAERTVRRPEPRAAPVREAEPRPETPAPPRDVAVPEPTPEPIPEVAAVMPAPPPAGGVLHVDSDVPGAMVFLDRRYLGTTPLELAELEPGPHRLNVSVEGYEGFAQAVEIANDPVEIMVKFREVRLEQAVEVVHKHRLGSCKGRLVADLQGLHYETSHKDTFSIRLADIEEFEIDYLAHNLKIKPHGGRTYNFTDNHGNADVLFVFHREVEQALARLSHGGTPIVETAR